MQFGSEILSFFFNSTALPKFSQGIQIASESIITTAFSVHLNDDNRCVIDHRNNLRYLFRQSELPEIDLSILVPFLVW